MSRTKRASLAFSCALCAGVLLAPAAATAEGNAPAAEHLFREALKLMAKGSYEEACPKLAESQKLDPGIGTLLHLGDCYAKLGKTASAWSVYQEAADAAHRKKQLGRERQARQKVAVIEKKVPKLQIDVSDAVRVAGMTISREGEDVGRVLWNTEIPVDPGTYTIEVVAPGKRKNSEKVIVPEGNETTHFTVSALSDIPKPKPPPEPVSEGVKMTPVRIAGIGVGALGLVAMGVSIGMGAIAKSRFDESLPRCTGRFCDAGGVAIRADAVGIADAGTGVFIGGAVCAAGGAALAIFGPALFGDGSGDKKTGSERPPLRVMVSPTMVILKGDF